MRDHARFRAPFAALELLRLFPIEQRREISLLDVGGGDGVHKGFFEHNGIHVDLVDIAQGNPERLYVGDFLQFRPPRRYSIVWASHVLEHILDPGAFIQRMIACTQEDGFICITVPPAKREMTFGHVSLWNAGLLLIHLIKAGLDCRKAKVLTRGYNVSVMTQLALRNDADYAKYLPPEINTSQGYFDGEIDMINWEIVSIPSDMRITGIEDEPVSEIEKHCRDKEESGFVLARRAEDPGPRFMWWDRPMDRLVTVS